MDEIQRLGTINFFLGDTEHRVRSEDVNAETTLNTYLREKAHLTGTKRMCLEGGCGSCIVAIEEIVDGKKRILAVNSCLVSILSCHDVKITTNDGIGNPLIGYHPIQKLLADNNGSQCGFCSSGMVMNMYALHESGSKTKAEIENSFGGNLCRCTGYRPILTAFKKLASDADRIQDIEESIQCQSGYDCNKKCKDTRCKIVLKSYFFELADSKWIKVHNLNDLLQVLGLYTTKNCMLVAGNTAKGAIRPATLPDLYIDITGVKELTNITISETAIVLGANTTLATAMEAFYQFSKQYTQFAFLKDLADHIDLVANVPVRNIGTIAGNLMLKHQHNEFPSDIFLIMETFNAVLEIVDVYMNITRASPANFLKLDMTKKVLKNITLSALDNSYKYTTYKIMPRAQNVHATVNAGFLFKFNKDTNPLVQSARIVFGGINPQFIHATKAEAAAEGKMLFDNNVLHKIFQALDTELVPDYVLPDARPQYRKQLAISLFYKFILKIAPHNLLDNKFISGGTILERPVSTGTQEFGTEKEKWPLTEPVIKTEALAQTSGQAEYIDDFPDLPNQLFAAFVTARTPANSQIMGIDTSEALKMAGVVAFFDKNDIPGENSFVPKLGAFLVQEELFCSGKVQYFDQPIGIIVANNQELAWEAAEVVKVTYSPPATPPLLNIKDVLKANAKDRIQHNTTLVPKRKGNDIKKVVKGNFYMGWQYHFHMEVQCCNVVPIEDGLSIYPASQWMDLTQLGAAAALNLPMNKINVVIRRCGGGFGGKNTRSGIISTATALAAFKLQKPVRMWLPLESNMNIIGKRCPFYVEYETGVNSEGLIQYLNADLYSDFGVGINEPFDDLVVSGFESCYDISTWDFSTYGVSTDTHGNTICRAPGNVEGIGAIENVMEQISYELNLDPIAVKLANTDKTKYGKILDFWKDMQNWGEVIKRKQAIEEFNNANRWKKRGMSLVPMAFFLQLSGTYTILVSIFHGDGTVVIHHGGIEIGQGINTKARQVCAYKLGIPLEYVSVKPSYNAASTNSQTTGHSTTSEAVCFGVLKACDELNKRITPIKEKMTNPTWKDLINKCYSSDVNLTAVGFFSSEQVKIPEYEIYGVCATEVEVDVLTGQKEILSVDLIEDLGNSMSPLIDIGQVEGAFVMGLGYYITEEIIFDEKGQLKTNRTWNYIPPGAKDIPQNFRIKFPNNNPNPAGILQSKAVGEPPLCLSVSLPLAIRNAIASARKNADPDGSRYFLFDGPTTPEKTFLNSLNSYDQYKLY